MKPVLNKRHLASPLEVVSIRSIRFYRILVKKTNIKLICTPLSQKQYFLLFFIILTI